MAAPDYATCITEARQHLTKDEQFLTSTLLALDSAVTQLVTTTGQTPSFPTILFADCQSDLVIITQMSLFNKTKTGAFLVYEKNDYWNMPPPECNDPQWTPQALRTGIPLDWVQDLQAALVSDLTTIATHIRGLNFPPARSATANRQDQAPGMPSPAPQPPNADQNTARLPSAAVHCLPAQPVQNQIAPARLPECARPISSFLNAGPKTNAVTRSVQVSYGEDNSFILSAPHYTRPLETMTASMFHSASLKMQSTVYVYLDLHLFHNNILANYMDKYTMSSILSYEHAVRQLVHELPPGTTFQPVYLELASLHLVTKEEAMYRQQVLTLQSSSFQQQRFDSAHAQQPAGSRAAVATVHNRPSIIPASFPPCHNFATKECNSIINGKCSRDHACAACGKSYPSQRSCPAGHKGEEVCPGVTKLIAQRLSSLPSTKRLFPDAQGGSDKRRRSAN